MGYIIKKPIATDKGVLTNAYVRLGSYTIGKNERISFGIEVFSSKESSNQNDTVSKMIPIINPNCIVCREIGFSLEFNNSYKNVIATQGTRDNDVEDMLFVKLNIQPLDLSVFENKTIFEVGYEKLHEHLIKLYGEENIEIF